jgi:hypothetical protein
MSDSTTTSIAIVAIITGIGSALALILKHIKHSECSKCCIIDTRTPPDTPNIQLTAPPPSPINTHKNDKNDKNNNDNNIREIEV